MGWAERAAEEAERAEERYRFLEEAYPLKCVENRALRDTLTLLVQEVKVMVKYVGTPDLPIHKIVKMAEEVLCESEEWDRPEHGDQTPSL